MLKKTTAQIKIRKLRKRVRVVRGGTSASKTFSIIPFLIEYGINRPKSEISIVAETIPHLRRGAMRDFLKIMDLIDLYRDEQFNKSSLTYTFSNGSYIEFFSADNSSKLRGARRDVLFVNECNNITWESYYQLAIRTRKFIYLDYNPVQEFWVDHELLGDPDTDFIILTYKDNEALDPSIIKEIEKAKEKAATSTYWANWWKVYGLGELGSLEGVIFKDWKQIDSLPQDAKLLGYGLDFGYTSDPSACVGLYKYNDGYILDEVLYRTGMLNRDIYNHCKGREGLFIADSAEPKSIAELQGYGMQVVPASKGKDSVIHGIQLLQGVELYVTSQSINLIKELRNYVWEKDRFGNTVANVPIDGYNHLIDASRYVAQRYISKSHGIYSLG
jgi:phage terminase large subunit